MWQSTSIKKCKKGLSEHPVRTYSLGLSWRQPREGIFGASIWTSQSLIHSRLVPTYRTGPLRLPSPFTSMKFLPVVAVLHPGRPSVSKSVSALAATQNIVCLAHQLTLVRTIGRACSRAQRQITQRRLIQAKMVQIRVAFTPEMGRERGLSRPG